MHHEINFHAPSQKYILNFTPYNFSIIDVDIFFYKVGQTLLSLTLTKSYMQTKKMEGV